MLFSATFAQCSTKILNEQAKDKTILINDSLYGEKLLSDKEFILSINSSCKDDSELCTVAQIKNNYYFQFKNLNNDETTISQLKDKIELKLKKTRTQNQFFMEVELISYKNDKKVDSIICYKYSNDPNDSLAIEKLYYLNGYYLWTLDFTYDVESTTAENWTKYKINPNSGKFELIDKIRQW